MSTSAIHIAQLAALEKLAASLKAQVEALSAKVDGVQSKMDKLDKLDKMPQAVPKVITQTPRGPGRSREL